MSKDQIILRVSATRDLKVKAGDEVRAGERIREGPDEDGPAFAPVSGVVKEIQFDPGRHEFVLVIAPV